MQSKPARTRRPVVVARKSRWRTLFFLAAAGAAGYLFLSGDDGFPRLWRRWQRLEEIQAHLERLEAENDSLRQVLWRLENDLDYVEKVAREEYGMSKKGERVYRLHPPEKD